MQETHPVTATINGREETFETVGLESLMDALRNRLHLSGTKEGCREGECGACTVLLDGKPINACTYMARAAEGREIETIEGLQDDLSSRIKQAIVETSGVQCGYCTPGMLLTAQDLLAANPAPSRDEIRAYLSGNYCRCTGYQAIVDAIESVAASRRGTEA